VPVIVSSINVHDTNSASPAKIIGRSRGLEVWRYESPGNHEWKRVTAGAGREIDALVFEGPRSYYDDLAVDLAPDSDGDGYTDGDERATGH
jgi:hypothetical protein